MKIDGPLAEVMTPHPRCVRIDQKLSDVRAALADHRIHHLPVVDGRQLAGIISVKDLLDFGFEPRDTHTDRDEFIDEHFSIRQIMKSDVTTIPNGGSIRDAALALSTGELHAVPVVDDDANLVGIVTSTDLVSYLLSSA
ncbi:MAG: HPP family protein [Gammaproteobacteria bacterium]